MTRINTNVPSLVAQARLRQSNNDLRTSLERLSTGLRINKGSDDPAGLIASEALRSEITGLNKAISNTRRASQIISTADSALGQVSNLLNDIRGLVVEAANTGALSDDEIAANQLQVDSSLEAINRISQTTTFQGRKLLDGSLEFTVSSGSNYGTVTDLKVDQANLGTSGSVAVDVEISSAATQASLTNSAGFSSATNATATLKLNDEVTTTAGDFASNAALTLHFQATDSTISGATIQTLAVNGLGAGNETASYDANSNILTIRVDDTAATTAQNIVDAVNNSVSEFTADVSAGAGGDAITAAEAAAISETTDADSIAIAADAAGAAYNNVAISIVADAGTPAATPTAVYDSSANTLTITVNNSTNTTLAAIKTAVDATAFNATLTTNGDSSVNVSAGNVSDLEVTGDTGTTGGETLIDSLDLQINGKDGSDVFSFEAGATRNQVVAAINLVSDATGVAAAVSGSSIQLSTSAYGSSAFVDVTIVSEGANGTFESGFSGTTRATGTDIVASVNGVSAKGDGNSLSINTSTLDLSLTVADGSATDFDFTITGGGALFQLGSSVVSNQQARVGITSVNSARLGGASGRLFQLGSGGSADLTTDPNTASKIVTEAIDQVTSLRGRLGAFQATTLDSNLVSLTDTVNNLQEAESSIRDADFAAESANMTRAQILVQSGTNVLALANQGPQNVLALLR